MIAKRVDADFYDEMRIRVGSCIEKWMGEEIDQRLREDAHALPRVELNKRLEARRAVLDAMGKTAVPKIQTA